MAGKDIIMLNQKELKRLHIIHKILDEKLKQTEAVEILSISDRQIRRIVKEVRTNGDEGIAHKSRGKPSNRGIAKKTKDKIIKQYREKYKGFGPTLASEKLQEIDGIKISDETLRNWLIKSGDWEKRRKGRTHRKWRERRDNFGEMVQIDGSHHDWFEGRGEKSVLMGYIDDATGNIFGRFYEYEGTIPVMDSFRRYAIKHGIPMSLYLDKHTTYKSSAKPTIEDELNGKEPLSEFERAMKELGVEVIHAHSPQAKGRVERLFNTLQDRLVKEMRLKGIKDIKEANKFLEKYLPVYNKRFTVRPKGENNLHREIPEGIELDSILCFKSERSVRNDFTISYENKLYQLMDSVVKGRKVIVEEKIDGSMLLKYKGIKLKYKEITARVIKKEDKESIPIVSTRNKYKPRVDHPWRNRKVVTGKKDDKDMVEIQVQKPDISKLVKLGHF